MSWSVDHLVVGAATLEQKIAIRDGQSPLPPNAHFRLDCNPTFDPPITRREDGEFKPWPYWLFELLDEAGVERDAPMPAAGGHGCGHH